MDAYAVKHTVSRGCLVEPVERAAASHEGSGRERGALEGREAPAAAEAQSLSAGARRRSGPLVDHAASLQTNTSFITTSLIITGRRLTTSGAQAVAPSISNAGFAGSLITSTGRRNSCRFLWERDNRLNSVSRFKALLSYAH